MNDKDDLIVKLVQDVASIKTLMESDIKHIMQDMKRMSTELEKISLKADDIDIIKTRVKSLEKRVEKVENNHATAVKSLGALIATIVTGVIIALFQTLLKKGG